MAFQRPTLPELIERTFADITSRLSLNGAILRRSVVGVLSRVIGGASHLMHGHLEYIAKESIPDTAEDALERWASIWKIARKPASFAKRTINLTGTVNGTAIPAGTLLNRSDGVQYATLAEVTISAGAASAEVQAVDAGSLGNVDAGSTLNIVNPIAGVSSSVTVAAGGVDGADVENNDSLRARLLDRIRRPPHGGSESDYEQWALEVAGVTRAWVYPLHLGSGTVGVIFVRDDDANFIPDAAEVQAVQDYIDERRPVTADVLVYAPTPVVQDFTIAGSFTAATKASIEAELKDFFRRESVPGGTLYLSRINEAISLASGEEDHVLQVPSANVVRTSGQITTMGTITWA